MRRVMVVGGPGSGKSTFARRLGEITGLPVHHMDHIHWRPGWVERDRDEKDRLVAEVHARQAWIFEGGHSRSYPERTARADTMVWLDLPVSLRLWRVLRRSVLHLGEVRPDMSPDCPERVDLDFYRFVLRTRKTGRARIQAIADAPPPHLTVHHFKSRRAAEEFLARLRSPGTLNRAGPAPGTASR